MVLTKRSLRASSRAAEPVGLIATGSSPALAAFAVPHKRGWLLIPALRRLLKPASDLVWAMRMLPVERPALEHTLDRLGHVEPAAAHRCIERHDPMRAQALAQPGMQHRIRAAGRRLQPHLARSWMKQGQDLGCAAADVFVRLRRRSPSRVPRYAGMRHGLKGAGLVLTPDRQPKLCAERVGLLDQLFFAAVSGSLTRTAPTCLRLRITTPVSHQVRLFCQLRPASCRVRQIVNVLTFGSPSGALRKALCSKLKDHVAAPSCSRCGARAI